jgi:hypothetical protein
MALLGFLCEQNKYKSFFYEKSKQFPTKKKKLTKIVILMLTPRSFSKSKFYRDDNGNKTGAELQATIDNHGLYCIFYFC